MPPDYTTNDAVYISDNDAFTNATITLTTPAAYTGLSFLAAAGNGPVPVNYVITHQGGKTESGCSSLTIGSTVRARRLLCPTVGWRWIRHISTTSAAVIRSCRKVIFC